MKQLSILAIIGLSGNLAAQGGWVNNGATVQITSGTTLRVDNGGIQNINNGTIANNGDLYLDGNYDQATGASYTGGASSWLWFESSASVQTIRATSIPRLRVQNNNVLELLSDLTVSTELNLTGSGNLRLGNFNLSVPNGAIGGYDVTHYIITNSTGTLQQSMAAGDIKEFPVGNSLYNPVILLSNAGATDLFSVRVEDAVLTNGISGNAVTDHAVDCTWQISEGVAGGNDLDVALEWATSQELASFDRTQSGIAHWDGTQWEYPMSFTAALASFGRWVQTINGQTRFSPFVVTDIIADLPIELIEFSAQRQSPDRVKLSWATATELNNAGFEIERMLDTEEQFVSVGFVEGYGNSTTTIRYGFIDENAYSGLSYYRLRQVDLDGKVSYSDIRAVRGSEFGEAVVVLYPNPARDVAYLRFGVLPEGETSATVEVVDGRGVVVQSFVASLAAEQTLALEIADLPAGAYWVRLTTNQGGYRVLPLVKR